MQILRNVILSCRDFLGFALRKEPKPLKLKDWLGGLDSNQDSQLQRLMYYRLYDLPADGGEANGPRGPGKVRGRTTQPLYFSQDSRIRQPRPDLCGLHWCGN